MNERQKRLRERRLIKLSIVTGSAFTVWAIVVGIDGDSKSIIFDALFSMVGISLSGVSLLVNNFVRKPDDDDLPFGRAQFEPFSMTLQSAVIIFLCLYSLATSVMDIISGGKFVELDIALPYLIASIIGCFILWVYFKRKALQIRSEYVRIEATEWQLDALLSTGVLVVLSLGYFLRDTSLAFLIPYLDPGMVILISILFLRIPAFVATLGMMFVIMGATLLYNGGQALTLSNQPGFFFIGQGYVGPVPFVFILLVAVTFVLNVILRRTRLGLRMYAVGQNEAAAMLRGIGRSRYAFASCALGGLVLGIAGVVLASYSYGASALASGVDFLISALAATFLGSTMSRAGELTVVGTVIAAVFLASLSNGLILMGISNQALPGVQGIVLVLSISLGLLRRRSIGQILIF